MIGFKNKPGLVAYLTCGDPDLETSEAVALAAIAAGADVIELGVPFSDPVADGPVIQRASERALKSHTTLSDSIALGSRLRKAHPDAGLIIFSYLNPILRLGLSEFALELKSAALDGALITDLTIEESPDYIEVMRQQDLVTVFLAAPTSTDARLQAITRMSRGFIYAVSRTGITGQQQQLAVDAAELVSRIRRFTSLPIAVGFGISNAQQFSQVGKFADAAVIGSAVVSLVEQHGRSAAEPVRNFLTGLRQATEVSRGHLAIGN
jgi:tryptophan synthase alpha chain